MKTLLQLTKERDDAVKAVAAASSPKARAKATSDLESASMALATFQANLATSTAPRAPRVAAAAESEEDEEDESEEDEEDESDEDDEESDDGDDDSDDDGDDDDDSDDDSDDDEEEEEEASAKAAALASARASLRVAKKLKAPKAIAAARASLKAVKSAVAGKSTHASLRAAVQKVTGEKSLRSMLGALEGLAASARKTEELSARVEKSERRSRRQDVSAMLKAARQEGRVTKGEIEGLRADAMKMGTKWLKSHLGARPKIVRSTTEGAANGRTLAGGKDGDAPIVGAIDAQNLSAEQRKLVETMAAGAGLTFDAFLADMNKRTASAAATKGS